ncbi:MAG: transposase [Acidobacteriota bacterium]
MTFIFHLHDSSRYATIIPLTEFKNLIIELKEEKTLVQIASEHDIHPQQLTDWKATALRGLASVFENERKTEVKLRAVYEQQQEELYAEIGRLTTQLAWLKKKSGILSE